MEIAEFLLARIGEDEAQALTPPEHYAPFEREWAWCPKARTEPLGDLGGPDDDCTCGVDKWKPGRPLRECEAKRQIVGWYETGEIDSGYTEPNAIVVPHAVLRALAAPYAGHPDFLVGWAL